MEANKVLQKFDTSEGNLTDTEKQVIENYQNIIFPILEKLPFEAKDNFANILIDKGFSQYLTDAHHDVIKSCYLEKIKNTYVGTLQDEGNYARGNPYTSNTKEIQDFVDFKNKTYNRYGIKQHREPDVGTDLLHPEISERELDKLGSRENLVLSKAIEKQQSNKKNSAKKTSSNPLSLKISTLS